MRNWTNLFEALVASPVIEYREPGLGTFTHEDHRYNLNKLFKLSEDIPVDQFPISELTWVLDYDKPDPERVARADVTAPILIVIDDVDGEQRLVVVDGLHRLAKAVEEGLETLPGRMISHQMLRQCDLTVLIRSIRQRLHLGESYHDGDDDEYDYAAMSQKLVDQVVAFSADLPIIVEVRPYENRYGGGVHGVVLTDFYAKEPGQGVGSRVMRYMCDLADEYGLPLYTDAGGPRSRDYYLKFGFESSRTSGHMLMRPAPLPDWFHEED